MKKISLFIIVSIIFFCNSQAQTYFAYTATPPTIDGTIDEVWKIAPITTPNIIMDADPADTEAEGTPVGRQQLQNPAGTWRAMYDENNLYFLVQVNDLAPANSRAAGFYYAGDGVEIFLSRADGGGQTQFGFGYQVGTPKTYAGATNAAVQKTIVNIPGVGWVLEVLIPRSSIGLLATATNLKMELGINQSSTGDKRSAQILTWNNSRTHYSSSANYTLVDLACNKVITLSSDVSAICSGGSVLLSANLIDGNLPQDLPYIWEKNAGSGWITVTGSPTITAYIEDNPSVTTNYRVSYDLRTSCTTNVPVGSNPTITDISYLCNTNDIALTATATGGKTPYQYSIDGTNFQASNVFTINAAGDYTIKVKDDNNCEATLTKTFSIPTLTEVSYVCNINDISLTATATSGTSPYQYSIDGTNFQASNVFTVTTAGDYTVRVKDNNNCVTTLSKTVAIVNLTEVSYVCNTNDITLTATATSGTSPYQYSIDGTNFQASNIFTVTTTGDYTVRVKDNNNCAATLNKTLSKPSLTNISYVCNNNDNSDIALTATATSGTSPYQYSIDGTNFQPSNIFTVNAAGNYTVTVKDNNNCVATLSKTVAIPTLSLNPSGDLVIQVVPTTQTLLANSAEATFYVWSKNSEVITGESLDNYTINIDDSYMNTTNIYKVYSVAATGCVSNTETLNLIVMEEVILPTAIDITATGVANGNNLFAPAKGKKLYIFNRYGITVYEETVSTADSLNGWNGCWKGETGKEVDPGVYFYVLTTDFQTLKGAIQVVKTK